MKNIDVIIPARGGSKRLARKNLQAVGGIPLVGIATLQAEAIFRNWSNYNIIISSEDDEILKVAGIYGTKRPGFLADDFSLTIDVLKYHLKNSKADYGCLMQPSSPFRNVSELRKDSIDFIESGKDSLFQAVRNDSFFWGDENNKIEKINGVRVRTQDKEIILEETGAFYLFKRKELLASNDWIFGDIMPSFTDWAGVDIHTKQDLELSNKLWSREWLI